MGKTEFETDDSDVIQTIKDSVKTEIITAKDGREFTTRKVHEIELPPLVATVKVHSLTALADYLKDNFFDAELKKNAAVLVESPTEVFVGQSVDGRVDRRFWPLKAVADLPNLGTLFSGGFVSLEEANIALQAMCFATPERDDLIASLSKIVSSEALTAGDDGVSQEVTFQSGVKRVNDNVKNPVLLRPFRTFTEVDQPESPFILRLRKTDDHAMRVGLFESDGGAWRNVARLSIKAFLDAQLGNVGEAEKLGIPVLA